MAELVASGEKWKVFHGNSLEMLRAMSDNSVDSVVTDAPYGLSDEPDIVAVLTAWLAGEVYRHKSKGGFMGAKWDAFVPGPEFWKECLRVLKPGGHLVCFGGSRTYGLIEVGARLSGFWICDQLDWLYGSAMTHGLDIGKAFDKAAGVERKVVGTRKLTGNAAQSTKEKGGTYASNTNSVGVEAKEVPITEPATDEAKKWDGFSTTLKPAHEPILLAQKPFTGTFVENVRKWGTGALNVDGCRIGEELVCQHGSSMHKSQSQEGPTSDRERGSNTQIGRWPANVIMDEEAGALLDEAVGNRPGMSGGGKHKTKSQTIGGGGHDGNESHIRGDSGGPSRFFYSAKCQPSERHEGCHRLPRTKNDRKRERQDMAGTWLPRAKNTHPTVKVIALMRWLVRLVTPPGGHVVDIFLGSGATGIAAVVEGFRFTGGELDGRHARVAAARILHFEQVGHSLEKRKPPAKKSRSNRNQSSLFNEVANG